MRLLGLLIVALLLLAGCADGTAAREQSPSPDSSSRTTVVPKPGDASPEGQPPVDGPLEDTRTGAVPVSGEAGCIQRYAASAVADRAFAFDGTVTDIGGAGVTFDVHEWFVGDGPATYTVRMSGPTTSGMSESAPSYFVGTRMLVSGEQDGGPIAWACGFTRYYDEETAAAWRS